LLRRHCPVSTLLRPCPTPALAVAHCDVEAATLTQDGSPPITRTTFPTCRAHYPGGSSGCSCRLLPRSCSLPQMAGGSASALSLSTPAQASLTLPPAGSLSRPRRPLSRGSGPSGYPAGPLVSYQINRQFSGWLLPPQVIRAFRAHCQFRTFKHYARTERRRRTANGKSASFRVGHAAAGWVSSSPRCATAAAASASPATCTVGKANLMPFSSNAFLIIA